MSSVGSSTAKKISNTNVDMFSSQVKMNTVSKEIYDVPEVTVSPHFRKILSNDQDKNVCGFLSYKG